MKADSREKYFIIRLHILLKVQNTWHSTTAHTEKNNPFLLLLSRKDIVKAYQIQGNIFFLRFCN